MAFYFANFLTLSKVFLSSFYLFLERFGQNYKAFVIKSRPSKGSWAISLLRKRKLKIYRQNKKEEQISFVLMWKVSNKAVK